MFGLTNGDGKRAADQPMDDMKKARYDVQPSKVLHVRPVPRQTTNQDLINLFAPYAMGGGVKVFISQSQGHAFVELPDVSLAAQAIQHTSQQPLSLYGVQLQIEFSSRQEVSIQEEPTPNRVILASVTSLVYPVDLELLHTLFGKYGNILRMATFNRTTKKDGRDVEALQCLIEFEREVDATAAMQALQGRCIYAGCNELEVQYSRLSHLTVKNNNDKFRDFTIAPATANGSGAASSSAGVAAVPQMGGGIGAPLLTPGAAGSGAGAGGLLQTAGIGGANFGPPAGAGGNQVIVPNPFATLDAVSLSRLTNAQITALADQTRQAVFIAQSQGKQVVSPSLMGPQGGGPGGASVLGGVPSAVSSAAAMGTQFPKDLIDAGFSQANKDNTPVVMVHNLPVTPNVDPRKLFNLFSIYGNVTRVKILYNKADTAMIQFSDPFYATLAVFYLNAIHIEGAEISVQFSKNKSVAGAGQTDEIASAKNLSPNANDQRWGDNTESPGRIVRNASKPTSVLFCANFDDAVDENTIRGLVAQFAHVRKIVMPPCKEGSKLRMANVAVGSPAEAVSCVMNLHGLRVGERDLKVAFSRMKCED
uniref:RRM domain-containing protein n=1 Tax=Chromera velia CCMP2878 TaxID=1169474 RepID=A0A0G4HN47_9ALVE|eukprot:Cvel_1190.t1-p1 / transcript=Cvel_1190.t1 / gene=Cvel_1190 / organism=Chromera_velia_CCMP2878 / gene_product=Polypyrimidine tract-binding protein homolog 3, putative / transcript_product=Polypyrimidine tract-binding protein homolog 3, putative / location=Cvel_scaffold39:131319-137508(-) / protein_length=590 / sequence_SO=supercontig / SO=protein_coding / is_pseudo=false